MSNLYGKFSPTGASSSSHTWINSDFGSEYLEKLLDEKKNLAYLAHGFPICNELLNQEILRVSLTIPNQGFNEFELGTPNHINPLDMIPDFAALSLGPFDRSSNWSPLQQQRFGRQQGPPFDHMNAVPASLNSVMIKKFLRVDVPVDRLLGPRGNSLKRIEALTGCRVSIRGRGSIKDPNKVELLISKVEVENGWAWKTYDSNKSFDEEECLRGKPGYQHLNDQLHVLIEAESPANIVDAKLEQAKEIIEELLIPVGKANDLYKRQQLRELGMLKSQIGKDTSHGSSSKSACKPGASKRAASQGAL
ncbi:KH domain-containing protein [Tanacetum coccineum]